MGRRGRPRLLTPLLVGRLVASIEGGASLEQAAVEAGIGSRSLRRWRAIGQRELAGLSVEARLALALERAQPPKPIDWRASAAFLEQFEHWRLDDDLLGVEPEPLGTESDRLQP
jgi:hypothetical protein